MNNSIFPETPPPSTPEHDAMTEKDSNFFRQCQDFFNYLAGEGYILVKAESDNFRMFGEYERIELGLNDAPAALIMEYLDVNFDQWQSENEALQQWASQSEKPLD